MAHHQPHPLKGMSGEGPPIAPLQWKWRAGNRLSDMYFTAPLGNPTVRSRPELKDLLKTIPNPPDPTLFCWRVSAEIAKEVLNDIYWPLLYPNRIPRKARTKGTRKPRTTFRDFHASNTLAKSYLATIPGSEDRATSAPVRSISLGLEDECCTSPSKRTLMSGPALAADNSPAPQLSHFCWKINDEGGEHKFPISGDGPPNAPIGWKWFQDMTFTSPSNKTFRSKPELAKYLQTLDYPSGPQVSQFCWKINDEGGEHKFPISGDGPPNAPDRWKWYQDATFTSPSDKKFRSKLELAKYLQTLEYTNGPA